MSLSQQKFREIVFQLLFSDDVGEPDDEDMIHLIMNELAVTKKSVKQALEKVAFIKAKLTAIDQMIAKVSTSYEFHRLHVVTKNILRLGIYELFYDDSIPPRVAIAESIRLARKFGSPESSSFVNALLDNLYQSSIGGLVSQKSIQEAAIEMDLGEESAKKAAEEAKLQNDLKDESEED